MSSKVAFLLLLLVLSINVKAQYKREPNLAQLNVSIGILPVLNFTPKLFDYIPTEMLRITFGVNYLKGYLKGNLQYTNITSTNRPNCIMLDKSISYIYSAHLYKGFFINGGFQVGLNSIRIDDKNLPDFLGSETELSSGFEFGVEKRFKNKLGVSYSYKLQRIFATPRNTFSILDIGLVYYFNSSDRLKKWLE